MPPFLLSQKKIKISLIIHKFIVANVVKNLNRDRQDKQDVLFASILSIPVWRALA
jgi:hypothetical protein